MRVIVSSLLTFFFASENIYSQTRKINVKSSFLEDFPSNCGMNVDMDAFTKVGKKYYTFVADRMMSWYGAAHYCRSNDVNLASIESADEMDAIQEHLNSEEFINTYPTFTVATSQFWTSGNDLETLNVFKWLGTGQPMNYTKWAPNKSSKKKDPDENCVYLWTEGEKQYMEKVLCDKKAYFICEATTPQIIEVVVW